MVLACPIFSRIASLVFPLARVPLTHTLLSSAPRDAFSPTAEKKTNKIGRRPKRGAGGSVGGRPEGSIVSRAN